MSRFFCWFFLETELGRELQTLIEIKRNQRINQERAKRGYL